MNILHAMKKKLTMWGVCFAFLWLSAGNVCGQVYWNNGCDCDGGINTINVTIESGLRIDGRRYTYYYTGIRNASNYRTTSPGSVRTDNGTFTTDPDVLPTITPTRPPGGVYESASKFQSFWYASGSWQRNAGADFSSGLISYYGWYYLWTVTLADINYPDASMYPQLTPAPSPTYAHCGQGLLPIGLNDETFQTSHGHIHSYITLDIHNGLLCNPNHYRYFSWGSPHWSHRYFTYIVSNTGAGYWSTMSTHSEDYVTDGHFIVNADTHIRLTSETNPIAADPASQLSVRDLALPTLYSMRFDGTYNGQNAGGGTWWYAYGSQILENINSDQSVGYWAGLSVATTFNEGSKLYLGPKTSGQDNITVSNLNTGTFNIENYLCLNDAVDDHYPYQNHGMQYKIPSGNVTNTGTILLYNEWTGRTACPYPAVHALANGLTSGAGTDVSYIEITTPSIAENTFDGPMSGNWIVNTAGGNIYIHPFGLYPTGFTTTSVAGLTHTFTAANAFDMNQDFIYTNNNTTSPRLGFYGKGSDCCGFVATKTMDLTFIGASPETEAISNEAYVFVDGDILYDASASTVINGHLLLQGENYVEVNGKADIQTNNNHAANLLSPAGAIKVEGAFDFLQTGTSISGLTIFAEGLCSTSRCDIKEVGGVNSLSTQPDGGGYVWLNGRVTTTNVDRGFTTIQSNRHYVEMDNGYLHTGIDGDMLVGGYSAVEILNPHPSAPDTGVVINRNGVGNDVIRSDSGHVHVGFPFAYKQSAANSTLGSGLSVLASGRCDGSDCTNGYTGGYIKIDSFVTTKNFGLGYVRFISEKDFISFGRGLDHTGKDGNLLISGYRAVDINRDHPDVLANSNGVFIKRTGIGIDSIHSPGGHVDITDPYSFTQSSTAGLAGTGMFILAEGPCEDQSLSCNYLGGYIWLRNDVNTTNILEGVTKFETKNHYIRIGENSISHDQTGGHFTHLGENGDLMILAGTDATCDPACATSELILAKSWTLNDSVAQLNRRNFVWIGDDVNINMSGAQYNEGNAVIRSYGDIIQMDDSVTFNDNTGANLWIDGKRGIRTLGPTALFNNAFASAPPAGTATGVQTSPVDYSTAGQGFVTYLSEEGFIDFGKDQRAGYETLLIGENTPFSYVAKEPENALLIEGYSRVFFGDSVTISMAQAPATPPQQAGNAKIYSPNGWIKYADTLEYTGFDGDFLIYANGNLNDGVGNRSCWFDNYLTCGPDRGGFVLFDSITNITTKGKGITWIRSNEDDVIIGDMFTYKSDNGAGNGRFVMQAGQDIYGRNFDQGFVDTILIKQTGEDSILFEAQKTIHLEQNLIVDRQDALTGDITMKAGYPTFSYSEIYRRNASSKDDVLPFAGLGFLDWTASSDCTPADYDSRFPCISTRNGSGGSSVGGDIWFEGDVLFDLTQASGISDNTIQTTLRAFHSIFIDSTFTYQQDVKTGGDVLLFAETGNVEAAVTRQDASNFGVDGYIGDGDTVKFSILNEDFDKEIRIQAGNKVWNYPIISPVTNENEAPTLFSCWKIGCETDAEYFGNILFNKPFIMDNKGRGYTLLSAARDIETQVMAPFVFTFEGMHEASGDLKLTAGRHIETHAKMTFDYPKNDQANITMQAGRLNSLNLIASDLLCKAKEEGTSLTNPSVDTEPFEPDVETGGVNSSVNNAFAIGGKGNGSILLFDSLEFNYYGHGKIFLQAENGNIESDPYLHRYPGLPANPGGPRLTGNLGDGYMSGANGNAMQHDAQITFNHGGSGVTELKAIDIKLHDKIAYYVTNSAPNLQNGQFYLSAYDSILTRNIEYVNATDTGSVFITTAKFKTTAAACADDYCVTTPANCGLDNLPIQQGHIVLGYGADGILTDDALNANDSIVFDFSGNNATQGANVIIRAGYEGFDKSNKKGYGGNITFDFMKINMAAGNHDSGGYLEISTPNGNIWGKDSVVYKGLNGDIKVDAGKGSADDKDAIRWDGGVAGCAGGSEKTLNTYIIATCNKDTTWRTGNIMMKGASLNFSNGVGNATFLTREGFIDIYDAFTVDSMRGHLVKYAGTNTVTQTNNQYGDVSERDFQYTPVEYSGSVFFGADDNVMLNYGYSNNSNSADGYLFKGRGQYDVAAAAGSLTALADLKNPYYSTTYMPDPFIYRAIFNVNEDGYLWYHHSVWARNLHRMYRGCLDYIGSVCSGLAGVCETTDNFARPLTFNFDRDAKNDRIRSGGLGIVATNYIDLFTKFTYYGGNGSGMALVPGTSTLHGEPVSGYGLYIKSLFDGQKVEKRRASCENCGEQKAFPIGDFDKFPTFEWTYIGFHDNARIHTNNQKSLLEAPIVEFFGHAELDAYLERNFNTDLTIKADSIIFHDSAIFAGQDVKLLPFTIGEPREKDMRYGVINDLGSTRKFYNLFGPAISMPDRNTPVMEFGYQRCNEPLNTVHKVHNNRSLASKESTPLVGGDIIVTFKYDFALPIQNSVVANHARISFLTHDYGHRYGTGNTHACIRTDLLRIRNKVEFYTDSVEPVLRTGHLLMTSHEQMVSTNASGIYPHHLHLEPGSELSLPGDDKLSIIESTTIGGYGELHEDVMVKSNGIIAPGFASLMEHDCQTPFNQGKLTIHNLTMEKDALMRISLSERNCIYDPITSSDINCMQTDTLHVQDTLFLMGKIKLQVLFESDHIEPGCYLFLIYNDLTISREYVNNLELAEHRYGEYNLFLDKSEAGRVYLCIADEHIQPIQRYIHIHSIEGVTTNPVANLYHYQFDHEDFVFKAKYDVNTNPYEVYAIGYYSQKDVTLLGVDLGNGTYEYTIRMVVEPWDVYFSKEARGVANDGFLNQRVWTYKNTLYVNVDSKDIVSIYNLTGILSQKHEIQAGINKMTLSSGVYIVKLKDGTAYKVIIR